jgi:SET domain-containing protein
MGSKRTKGKAKRKQKNTDSATGDSRVWPVRLKRSELHGRGVFARRTIAKGEVVEQAPLIVLDGDDWDLVAETRLGGYVYELSKGRCAVAGGLGAFYNHASPANAEYRADAKREVVTVYAVRKIKSGEEVCINYNGDPGSTDAVEFGD